LHSSFAGAFQLGAVDYPPYSPDLALSDFHLFTYLKNFNNIEELLEGIKT
jgi:hypothetical protein